MKPILQALDCKGHKANYYALDLSPVSVRRSVDTISSIPFKNIQCYGVVGTYDDARDWLQSSENRDTPKCILSLGSSIGNLTDTEAVEFLKSFAGPLRCSKESCTDQRTAADNPMWTLLLGLDTCSSEQQIRAAYVDPFGANSRFLLNALDHVNALLGYKAFHREQWTVCREWDNACFKQYLVPMKDVMFEGTLLWAGTRVPIIRSQKFGTEQRTKLWEGAGVRQLLSLHCKDLKYGMVNRLWVGCRAKIVDRQRSQDLDDYIRGRQHLIPKNLWLLCVTPMLDLLGYAARIIEKEAWIAGAEKESRHNWMTEFIRRIRGKATLNRSCGLARESYPA